MSLRIHVDQLTRRTSGSSTSRCTTNLCVSYSLLNGLTLRLLLLLLYLLLTQLLILLLRLRRLLLRLLPRNLRRT